MRDQSAITLENFAGNEIKIDPINQWIEIVWHGAVTAEGIMDLFSRVYKMPSWHPSLARLMIYHTDSYIGDLDVVSSQVLRDHLIKHRDKIFGVETPLVGYISNDPLKQSYLEFWAELLNRDTPFRSRVFPNYGDAVAWVRSERTNAERPAAKL
jgi:hypothetical protein